jgi:hypothetical protein
MALPIPDRFVPQTIRKAICLTLASAGIKMPINRAMIAITTNSSTSVKPFFLFIFFSFFLFEIRKSDRFQVRFGLHLIDKCLLPHTHETLNTTPSAANLLNLINVFA